MGGMRVLLSAVVLPAEKPTSNRVDGAGHNTSGVCVNRQAGSIISRKKEFYAHHRVIFGGLGAPFLPSSLRPPDSGRSRFLATPFTHPGLPTLTVVSHGLIPGQGTDPIVAVLPGLETLRAPTGSPGPSAYDFYPVSYSRVWRQAPLDIEPPSLTPHSTPPARHVRPTSAHCTGLPADAEPRRPRVRPPERTTSGNAMPQSSAAAPRAGGGDCSRRCWGRRSRRRPSGRTSAHCTGLPADAEPRRPRVRPPERTTSGNAMPQSSAAAHRAGGGDGSGRRGRRSSPRPSMGGGRGAQR